MPVVMSVEHNQIVKANTPWKFNDMAKSMQGPTCSSLVSLESLKGTWVELGSARALMHIPRAVRDRLMLLASEALRPARAQGCHGELLQTPQLPNPKPRLSVTPCCV